VQQVRALHQIMVHVHGLQTAVEAVPNSCSMRRAGRLSPGNWMGTLLSFRWFPLSTTHCNWHCYSRHVLAARPPERPAPDSHTLDDVVPFASWMAVPFKHLLQAQRPCRRSRSSIRAANQASLLLLLRYSSMSLSFHHSAPVQSLKQLEPCLKCLLC
jgi:hypothetical protein